MPNDCPDLPTLKANLQAVLAAARQRLTPLDLEKQLAQRLSLSRRQARRAIHRLVEEGELIYTNEDGHTFVVPSFRRPVRISRRLWLSPPGCKVDCRIDDIVVRLQTGIAFGSGSHASTRLALQAIDILLNDNKTPQRSGLKTVLDIGTGSGVLVLAAVLMGLETGLGLDVDACARAEARENVRLNRLARRIRIASDPVGRLEGAYDLLTANLRLPSLLRYRQRFLELTAAGGWIVLSGIRTEESEDILAAYDRPPLKRHRQLSENGWTCWIFGQ
jgi:ribosomal protein L11 methyltransferase